MSMDPAIHAQVLASPATKWNRPLFATFLFGWAVAVVLELARFELPPSLRWTGGAFLALAAVTALVDLGRRLPLQNLVGLSVVIAGLSFAFESLGVSTVMPFGRYRYTEALGPRVAGLVPWPIPLGWICVLVTCRGVAREIVHPWRAARGHGFRVLGVAVILAMLLELSLEPFASISKRYWVWAPDPQATSWWSGVPWINWIGRPAAATAILALAFPWWINKHPIPAPATRQPVAIWVLLQLLFSIPNALAGQHAAAALAVFSSVAVWLWTWPRARRAI